MPPTISEVYESSWTSTTSPKTSSSLTVAAGDVLVVVAGGSSSNGALSVSDSQGLPWSGASQTTNQPVYLWAAVVATSGTLTVTVTRASGSSYFGFNVLRAQGAGGIGTPVTGSGTSGAPSLTLTTTTPNAGAVWVSGDNNSVSVSGRAWRSVNGAPTEAFASSPGASFYAAFWSDAGAAGSKTVGLSTPTGQKWSAVAVELLGETYVDHTYAPSWDVEAYVDHTYEPSWDVEELTVDHTYEPSWDVEAFVDHTYAPSWDVEAITGWEQLVASDLWRNRLASMDPLDYRCRVVLVDLQHRPVTVTDRWGEPMGEVPIVSGEVSMTGESDQVWSCSLTIEDERWVPRTAHDPLDPRSPYRIAIFWSVRLVGDAWGEIPLGVYRTGVPSISDQGTVTISVQGEDVHSVAKRGGYGGAVLTVGGLTVDAALARIYSTTAPTVPFVAAPSTVTLPAVYELGRRKPSEDSSEVAGLDQYVVRANREGNLTGGRQPDPQAVRLRLIEGDGCTMSEVTRELGDTLYNRVTVTGTNPDLTEPVFGMAEDDDESSPTYVGRFGPYELAIDSDAVTTNEAATNLARMHWGKYRRPAEKIKARIRPRPDLDYRDLVQVSRQRSGVVGEYRVSSWRMPLPVDGKAPGDMEVEFMSRQVDY